MAKHEFEKQPDRVKKSQIATRDERESATVIQQFCHANGQIMLPVME